MALKVTTEVITENVLFRINKKQYEVTVCVRPVTAALLPLKVIAVCAATFSGASDVAMNFNNLC